MATKKLKDDDGNEYDVDIDDDDDDDGPFIDEEDLRGLFDKWLGERESSKQIPPKKSGGIRIRAKQKAPPPKEQPKTRRLRLA